MGTLHSQGLGLPKDDGKAFALFRVAADAGAWGWKKGDRGRGRPADSQLARGPCSRARGGSPRLLLTRSPSTGLAKAQHNVAVAYSDGVGTLPDSVAALAYYERAAAQGFEPSQMNLGKAYLEGTLGVVDAARAAGLLRAVAPRLPAARELLRQAEAVVAAQAPAPTPAGGAGSRCAIM